MKIIFIRHGETNVKTRKLTLKGIMQVKSALNYIKDENVKAIFCSPRTRALQTANILNKKFNAPLFILKELNERQQLLFSQSHLLKQEFDANYLNYDYNNDNFETCKNFIDRTTIALNKIKEKYPGDQTVIVAAHSSTLYAINTYITGIPQNGKINWLQCSNGAVVKFHL